MSEDDFQKFLDYEEKRIFYRKFFSEYLISGHFLYINTVGGLDKNNILNIVSIDDLGHINIGRGNSFYLLVLNLKNGEKRSVKTKSMESHYNLQERLYSKQNKHHRNNT